MGTMGSKDGSLMMVSPFPAAAYIRKGNTHVLSPPENDVSTKTCDSTGLAVGTNLRARGCSSSADNKHCTRQVSGPISTESNSVDNFHETYGREIGGQERNSQSLSQSQVRMTQLTSDLVRPVKCCRFGERENLQCLHGHQQNMEPEYHIENHHQTFNDNSSMWGPQPASDSENGKCEHDRLFTGDDNHISFENKFMSGNFVQPMTTVETDCTLEKSQLSQFGPCGSTDEMVCASIMSTEYNSIRMANTSEFEKHSDSFDPSMKGPCYKPKLLRDVEAESSFGFSHEEPEPVATISTVEQQNTMHKTNGKEKLSSMSLDANMSSCDQTEMKGVGMLIQKQYADRSITRFEKDQLEDTTPCTKAHKNTCIPKSGNENYPCGNEKQNFGFSISDGSKTFEEKPALSNCRKSVNDVNNHAEMKDCTSVKQLEDTEYVKESDGMTSVKEVVETKNANQLKYMAPGRYTIKEPELLMSLKKIGDMSNRTQQDSGDTVIVNQPVRHKCKSTSTQCITNDVKNSGNMNDVKELADYTASQQGYKTNMEGMDDKTSLKKSVNRTVARKTEENNSVLYQKGGTKMKQEGNKMSFSQKGDNSSERGSKDKEDQQRRYDGSHSVNNMTLNQSFGTDSDFDAYLCVPSEDVVSFGKAFHKMLEIELGLKIFLPERDLLLTGVKFENIANIVKERCKQKVIVVLSANYFKSEECKFITYFTKILDPDSKKRSIIPVLTVEEGEPQIPEVLKGLSFIRYHQAKKHNWLNRRLLDAVKL